MTDQTTNITRLAPSPTGALHLGNARTFLINWALARQNGWRIVLRIEDIDTPRTKPGADAEIIAILEWLGLNWDDGPYYQLQNLEPCRNALDTLIGKDLVYPCACTRKDIEQAGSAPHRDDHELRYPGTCRDRHIKIDRHSDQKSAWRLKVPDEDLTFIDEVRGVQTFNVQQQVGDFVVATKAGLPAYQLAVVVDDARQHINHIVRGDDLISSTARQLWLYRMLELEGDPQHHAIPRYWHLPLVCGPDGRRLAKRHGDTRIDQYRRRGVAPERIIGLIAYWSGAVPSRTDMTAKEFVSSFDITKLPMHPITYSATDESRLTNHL